MKKLIAALTIALSLTVLIGCGDDHDHDHETESVTTEVSEEAEDQEPTEENVTTEAASMDKIVITYVTSPLNVPSMIDQQLDIISNKFAEVGVTVEYAEITSGADQTQALASGDVHILNAVGASSVILSAAAEADIKVLSMYSTSPEAFAMYTGDETIQSPEDLVGKIVAGPVGTNLHQLLIAYLATADMTIDDIEYVNMGIPEAKAGLDGGSVDVALIGGATGYVALEEGYVMIADGQGLIDAAIAVSVTEKFYNDHADMVALFLEAQMEIEAYMNDNFDETISIVAEVMDMEEEAILAMYPQYDFSNAINADAIAAFQRTADFMLEADMIEVEVDINGLFFTE
ncbi:MAG: NrtA/SsuA/CpmA family ABC transporter substrate-binding protein [Eubacteriales bacterium]